MNSPTIEAYGRLRAAFELAEIEATMLRHPPPVVMVNTADLGMVINAFRDQESPMLRAVIELCETRFRVYADTRYADICAMALAKPPGARTISKGETQVDTEQAKAVEQQADHYDTVADAYREAAIRCRAALADARIPFGIVDRVTTTTALSVARDALKVAQPHLAGLVTVSPDERALVEQALEALNHIAPVTV